MNTTSSLAALHKSTTYELGRPEGRVVGTPGHATAERYVALSLPSELGPSFNRQPASVTRGAQVPQKVW